MNMRKLIQQFFDRHEVAWEIFMMVLAVIYVVTGFLPLWIRFSREGYYLLNAANWGITGFFILEFVVRFSVAPSRKGYLKGHWLDLVSIVPPVRWLRLTRVLRVLRILRVVRAAKALHSLDVLGTDIINFGEMNGLVWMLLSLVLIMLALSGVLFFSEHLVNKAITSYWDALYAALVTWTTPGYGDIFPITTAGRVAGFLLILSGLITWGILIANLSAFLTSLSPGKNNKSQQTR